jgi:inner membrane protein YhjD
VAGGEDGRRGVSRLDRYQRDHRWLGLPIAVVYKFFDDQGGYLAALVTYYAFLSLFPLLLLLVTVLGFLLAADPSLQQRVLDSALSQFPVIGTQLGENVKSLQGNRFALVAGVLTSLYGGLGVAQAAQAAMNRVWAVPRNARPDPVRARLRSLLALVVFGGGVLATTAVTALTTSAGSLLPDLGAGGRVLSTVVAVALNSLLFVVMFRVLTAPHVPVRQLRGGAVGAAVVWQLLELGGTFLVSHRLQGASATYGLFGIVLGLMAWLWLGAITVVVAGEVNVVRARRLWPRSLLTPFTDDVRLTSADEAAYTSYAKSEQHKGFQTVDVEFDRPDEPSERPRA